MKFQFLPENFSRSENAPPFETRKIRHFEVERIFLENKKMVEEFFAPTDDVKLVREDGSTVGAVKIEATRHGVPNWSDHKTLSVSFMGL